MFEFMRFFNFVVLAHHLWTRVGTAFAACDVPQLRHGVTFAEMMADPTISRFAGTASMQLYVSTDTVCTTEGFTHTTHGMIVVPSMYVVYQNS